MTEESEELWERWRCEVDKGQAPIRIDKYLSEHMNGTSRNRIQNAADAGNIWVNGKAVKNNYKVKPGDVVQVLLDHEPYDSTIQPEDIPLDIVYEDADLMVINKPAGLVVHPGHGNYEHTLLNGLAYYF
jgi:23S rRNA pseudouridine1911/1915/1917 synthase